MTGQIIEVMSLSARQITEAMSLSALAFSLCLALPTRHIDARDAQPLRRLRPGPPDEHPQGINPGLNEHSQGVVSLLCLIT